MAIRDILQNNALMMLFAFIFGFAIGGFPAHNADIAMACLVIVMSLSLGGLKIRGMRLREHTKPVIVALLACFGVSSIVTILLGSLFGDIEIRTGWVIVASVPSAIAVIPFTYLLKGDLQFSLVASTVIYVLSLAITPLMTLLFLGSPVDQVTLLWYVIVLIFLPLAASRALVKVPMSGQTRTILINIAFSVMFFAITGSNRNAFFGDPVLIIALLFVAFARTFIVGGAVEFIARRLRVEKKKRIPIILFSTYKNTGMAAALASVLIGSVAAIPATVCLAMEVAWFVALTKAIYPLEGK